LPVKIWRIASGLLNMTSIGGPTGIRSVKHSP